MSAYSERPRIDGDGRRRPLELTTALGQSLFEYPPGTPQLMLVHVDALVFHLVWPPGAALCGTFAKRKPLQSPDSPMLCGTCAWKFETAAGRELVE